MNNGSVLLVEDEQIIAMDLQESLEEMGYHVLGPACNADEALALARQHKPDMALLDIMIEGPVDGIDTAVELTQINIPCVFLTAYSDSHTLQRAAAISPYGILTKPVERPVLAVTLEQTLYKARLEAELRERHQRLASSEARLRAVFMDNPDAILVVDQQGAIVNINPRTADLFGYSEAELIGSPIEMLLPDQVRSQHVSHRQAFTAHPQLRPMGAGVALLARRADGAEFPVDVMLSPMHSENQRLVIAIVRDITERKKQEMQLNNTLREKDTLLKEVYHRVKNNLQVIQSLLNMERRSLVEESARIALADIAARVNAMALVHEKLYQSGNLSSLSLSEYVRDLVRQLQQSGTIDSRRISVVMTVAETTMGIDTAIPLGLLINELVSNCIKHAFPDQRQGRITISISHDDDKMALLIADNGVGLPAGFDADKAASMGLKLARSLARQLKGNMIISSDAGARVLVEMKQCWAADADVGAGT